MISLQKKFLFIHVPKTGGNSIQSVLKDFSEDKIVALNKRQDGLETFEIRNSRYNIEKHSNLSYYKTCLEPHIYHSLFKFAVMRNPWDMMISFYFSPIRGIQRWNRDAFLKLLNRTATLRDYICDINFLERGFRKIRIHPPLVRKRLDKDIDFLMKFEHLEDDFKILCERLEIPIVTLPRRNKSERLHYSAYYDDELRKIVQDKFKEEIEFGKYVF